MFQFATQPLSIPQIWRAGINLYKAAFTKIWYLLVIFAIIAAGNTLLIKIINLSARMQNHTNIPPLMLGISIISIIISVLIGLYLSLLLLHRMQQTVVAENEPLKNSFKIAWKKYWIYFLNMIYIMLLLLAMALAFGLALSILSIPVILLKQFVPAFAAWLIDAKPIAMTLAIIAVITLAIPFICIMAITFLALMFGAPIILFENIGAWTAVKEAFKLIWGKYWRIVTGLVIPAQIILIVPLILYAIAIFNPQNTILWVIYYIVWITTHTFFYLPIYSALTLVQFNDLKLRQTMKITWIPR